MRLWGAQAARAESEAQNAQDRLDALIVRSPRAGMFVVPRPSDLQQAWLERGSPIGHVVDPSELVVRVAVHQDQAELVRGRTLSVSLRSADRLDRIVPGRIVREVPTIGRQIASRALTSEGGGVFALDPASKEGPVTLEPVLQFDVLPLEPLGSEALGMRVYVRIDHGNAPIAERLWWRVRQVFLRRLNV
jgi:putative peptide zinc metalloprotease protein